MKQIISFKKDIPFNTKISEITSISLEHNLKLVEQDLISGEFIVSGDYKITDSSINSEPFSFNLPFDIALDIKYNIGNAKVDIDDFYYEIENDQLMKVNIDVLVDGIEVIDDLIFKKEEPKMDDRIVEVKEVEDERESEKLEVSEEVQEEEFSDEDREIMDLFQEIEEPAIDVAVGPNVMSGEKIKSLFDSFDDSNESFTTYHVHIVRESDTLNQLLLSTTLLKKR